MADDQICPVKCDLIRSCFINALLRYKQNNNFVVFTQKQDAEIYFSSGLLILNFFKIYLNSTVVFVT